MIKVKDVKQNRLKIQVYQAGETSYQEARAISELLRGKHVDMEGKELKHFKYLYERFLLYSETEKNLKVLNMVGELDALVEGINHEFRETDKWMVNLFSGFHVKDNVSTEFTEQGNIAQATCSLMYETDGETFLVGTIIYSDFMGKHTDVFLKLKGENWGDKFSLSLDNMVFIKNRINVKVRQILRDAGL